jgi:hypothetical protein
MGLAFKNYKKYLGDKYAYEEHMGKNSISA